MIYNLFFFELFMLGILFVLMSLILFLKKMFFFISWILFSMHSFKFEFIFYIDWMSLMFIGVVLMISSLVLMYSKEYMHGDFFYNGFVKLLIMFVGSMLLMIISPNLISIILGWDGLGLISYCLIIYYNNYSSNISGMITILMNRVGDVMLLMLIIFMISLGSWNLMNYYLMFLLSFFLIIMSMTKSAQIPFSLWLPLAMAAPTPVSSLVHSSTLVTAGVYILIRYYYMINNNFLFKYLMLFGLVTMFFSSFSAWLDFDFKKIIAYSTLSQLGLMMFILSLGLLDFTFFHLISHAMFKSLLFLCSGFVIHSLHCFQDIRFMGASMSKSPLLMLYFNFSNLSLMGMPFMSGFYSKDLLFEMTMYSGFFNILIYLILYMSIFFTVIYSIRLLYYSIFIENLFTSLVKVSDSFLMILSMTLLFFMSLILGSFFSWLMYSMVSFKMVSFEIKLLMYFNLIFGVFISIFLSIDGFFSFYMPSMLYYLFKLTWDYFYALGIINILNLFFLSKSGDYFNSFEKSWNEMFFKNFMMYIYIEFIKIFKFNKNFFMMFLMVGYYMIISFIINL